MQSLSYSILESWLLRVAPMYRNQLNGVFPPLLTKVLYYVVWLHLNNIAPLAFGFWLGSVMKDPHNILISEKKTAMGNFGQIKSVADLPNHKIILDYIKQALQLIYKGVKLPKKEKGKEALEPHPSFVGALAGQKIAEGNFNKFSPSHKREYIEWINDAKTEPTRNKRIADAIQWLQEGKLRNWKYEK